MEFFIITFSDRIVHMHVHDNNSESDQHLGIGYGTVNWKKFANLLKTTSYDKTVIVESVEHIEESMRRLKQLFA